MDYGFVIDNRRCIGCHACTVACKAEHDVPLGVNRTWVKYVEKGTFPDTRRLFSVLRCNHCSDAPCTTICPVTALYTREDGIVDFDPDRCIGCKACIQGCPYDALYIDPVSGTAAKCNYCAHRVEVGLEPPCAVVCPEHAIVAGDLDDPSTEIARLVKLERIQVRKPEKGTRPKVFYIEGDTASLNPSATATSHEYIWSQGREPGVAPRDPASALPGPGATGVLEDSVWDRVRAVMGDKADAARRVYDAGQTHQDSWGWKVSAYLWTKSIASGCLVLAPFLAADLAAAAALLALIFLAATGGLLVADLRRPDRFLWVLTRPQWRSWLTRGSYILLGAGAVAIGLLVSLLTDRPGLTRILALPAILLGAGAAAYTAFLFWQSKGRDLWQSPLLPVHLLVQAVLAGLCALGAAGHLLGRPPAFRDGLLIALGVNAALILLELCALHPTEDAARAARWARTGLAGQQLVAGVFLLGHAVPAVLIWSGEGIASAAAGLLALAGLALWEQLYVRAGQSVALS